MGFFSTGPSDLGVVCTCLVLLTGLSASLISMMSALMASITAHIITCVMFCSAGIFAMVFLRLSCVSLPDSSIH